jgi:uncharacterized protein YjiS (DUF1127 family)
MNGPFSASSGTILQDRHNQTNIPMESPMTATLATHFFHEEETNPRASTIVAWLIARIRRKRSHNRRRSGSAWLSDATLSDLGITREQAEFGRNAATRH